MFPSLDCWVLYVAYRAFLDFKLLPFSLVWKRHAPLSLPHVKRKTNINHALLSHLYVPALHAGQVLKKAWARKVWCTAGCKENKILGLKALNCDVPAWKSFSLTLERFILCRASIIWISSKNFPRNFASPYPWESDGQSLLDPLAPGYGTGLSLYTDRIRDLQKWVANLQAA